MTRRPHAPRGLARPRATTVRATTHGVAAFALLFSLLTWGLPSAAFASASEPGAGAEDGAKTPWMHRDRIYDVTIQGDHFWIVGYPGVILHSPDKGVTWEPQDSGGEEALYSVDFVDEKHGWIVGRRGLVLHTADGGVTWQTQKSGTTEPILAVDFVDLKHGWAVGNFALILHTKDGGQTWAPQSLGPDEDAVLNGVSFVSPTEGWLAGEFGTIAHTTDGGTSWKRQDTGVERALFGLSFRNDHDGIAVGSAGTILITTDGGATWKKHAFKLRDPLLDVHFGETFSWACGRGGYLVKRRDDGTFEAVHVGVYVWLAAVAFAPDGTGLAVGRAGTILRTADGGNTWNVLPIKR